MSKICPLCGKDNGCTGDKNCWCMNFTIPEAARKKVPPDKRGACICKQCAAAYGGTDRKGVDFMNEMERLKKIIEEHENIVFFGGAGVSTESNIPDFRSSTGLYSTSDNRRYPPEYMLSHSCFARQTEDFFRYYKTNILYPHAKPNAAHFALARLEAAGKLKAVITQNIDGLHQAAGSRKVIELHGSVHDNYCTRCGKKGFSMNYVANSPQPIPHCDEKGCDGIVRPNVVLYEEALNMDAIEEAVEYISQAEVLLVGGTSLVVYPAAGLINYYRGNHLILINRSATSRDSVAELTINDSIGKVLSAIIP